MKPLIEVPLAELEAAEAMPRIVAIARADGYLTYSGLLRYHRIPYGVAGRCIRSLMDAGKLRRAGLFMIWNGGEA
jgi:hypothetical protein